MIFSMIAEIFIWLCAFKKQARSTLFVSKNKSMTYIVWLIYAFLGLVAKGDIYTDIAFLVEMNKWNEQNKGLLGIVIWLISVIVFAMTLLYQFFWLSMLVFRSPKGTFWPLTSHTTRVLLCADYRLLAMFVEKFSVSYYSNFYCLQTSTNKILAASKLVFEDIIQCSLQVIYLLLARGREKSISVIVISLCFAAPSIGSSVFALVYNTTSTLTDEQYDNILKYRNTKKEVSASCSMVSEIGAPIGDSQNDVSATPISHNFREDRTSNREEEKVAKNSDEEEKAHRADYEENSRMVTPLYLRKSPQHVRQLSSGGSFSTFERAPSTQRDNLVNNHFDFKPNRVKEKNWTLEGSSWLDSSLEEPSRVQFFSLTLFGLKKELNSRRFFQRWI